MEQITIEDISIFAEGLDHPECVAMHPDGSVWAGGEGGQIYRISPDGNQVSEVGNTGGFILGIAFHPSGEWLMVCDLGQHCLWKYHIHDARLEKFADGCDGHNFNIPNYAVFDNTGNCYVSESGAFREISGKVLKFDPDGKGSVWHPGPMNFTNGMALDARQEYLYVVSSFLPGVERIRIRPDGSAGETEVYCTLPKTVPDGIAFYAQGNLYVSCYAPNAIFKVTPERTTTCIIDDWEAHTLSNPTNIAFGGPAMDQLFAANLGRWHISRIDLGIVGLPLPAQISL